MPSDTAPGTAIVTGANSGVGFFTARDLAERGMHVVLACRDHARGAAAIERIRGELTDADLELGVLDLADLSSVKAFAERYAGDHDGLDVLVSNAAVMAVPDRRTTVQGFELQFGTNHLGHFALVGRLLGALAARPGSRVVTVSSVVHRRASIDFDDLQSERHYSPWQAYAASKLANLLFAFELDRRLEGWGMRDPISVAAHPGFATTNLLKGARVWAGPCCGRGPCGSSRPSPRSRPAAAHCRSCTRQRTRESMAAASTGPPAGGNCAAIRRASHLQRVRWTPAQPGGSGRSPETLTGVRFSPPPVSEDGSSTTRS